MGFFFVNYIIPSELHVYIAQFKKKILKGSQTGTPLDTMMHIGVVKLFGQMYILVMNVSFS